jgi:hypothetical protein
MLKTYQLKHNDKNIRRNRQISNMLAVELVLLSGPRRRCRAAAAAGVFVTPPPPAAKRRRAATTAAATDVVPA